MKKTYQEKTRRYTTSVAFIGWVVPVGHTQVGSAKCQGWHNWNRYYQIDFIYHSWSLCLSNKIIVLAYEFWIVKATCDIMWSTGFSVSHMRPTTNSVVKPGCSKCSQVISRTALTISCQALFFAKRSSDSPGLTSVITSQPRLFLACASLPSVFL